MRLNQYVAGILMVSMSATSVIAEDSASVRMADELLQKQAAELLIFGSLISSHVEEITVVSPEVQSKYQSMRNAAFSGLPLAAVGASLTYTAGKSAKHFESVLASVTVAFTAIAEGVKSSATKFMDLLEFVGVDKSIRFSGDSLEATFKFLAETLASVSTGGTKYAVGSSALSAVLTSSVYMAVQPTAEQAMSFSQARALLGYDEQVMAEIDTVTRNLSGIFKLDSRAQAQFKEALLDAAVQKAIDNRFDRNADYTIDLIAVMESKQLIPSDLARTARVISEIYVATTRQELDRNEIPAIAANLDVVTAISAVLEQMLVDGNLNAEDEKSVRYLLAKTARTLETVQFVFSNRR